MSDVRRQDDRSQIGGTSTSATVTCSCSTSRARGRTPPVPAWTRATRARRCDPVDVVPTRNDNSLACGGQRSVVEIALSVSRGSGCGFWRALLLWATE